MVPTSLKQSDCYSNKNREDIAEKVSRQNDGVLSEASAEDSTSDEEMSDTVNEMSYSETSDLEGTGTENETNDDSASNVVQGGNDAEFSDDDTDTETDFSSHMTVPDNIPYRRMQCMAHTLQLVVKQVYKGQYENVIAKARKAVQKIRNSSAAEKLALRCGKTAVSDCVTRWNSTYYMAERLIDIKQHVNIVLAEAGKDTLLTNEWTKLEEMCALLAPFRTHRHFAELSIKFIKRYSIVI